MNRIFPAIAALLSIALAQPALATTPDFDEGRIEVAGPDGDWHKLTRVAYAMPVDATPDEAWQVLADFGGVQDYSSSIYESRWIGDAVLDDDAARYCKISFQGRDVLVKERIFELDEEGEERSFTYDVYDWTNFPLKRMQNSFGVYVEGGQTYVYNVIDYKLKPAVMTGMMKGQMRKSARRALLGVKHYLETGDGTVETDALEAMYPNA